MKNIIKFIILAAILGASAYFIMQYYKNVNLDSIKIQRHHHGA